MTIEQFLDILGRYPQVIILFLGFLPLASFIHGRYIAGARIAESPHRFVMSTLVYLACVPGIFAVTLSVYVFVFERRSIFQTDIYTQVLPIVSMIATLLIIRRTVDLDSIPGFDKITGLIVVIFAVFSIFWVLDKTHIWVVSYLPFWQGVLIFIGLLIAIRYGWTKMVKRG